MALTAYERTLIPLYRELQERLKWFIWLRWLAVAGVFLGGWTATTYIVSSLSPGPFYLVGLAIAGYNTLFILAVRFLWPGMAVHMKYERFIYAQIGLDWVALLSLVHYAGGIQSPVALAITFHIIFGAILLSRKACYALAAVASLLLGALAIIEGTEILPHVVIGNLNLSVLYTPLAGFYRWLFLTSFLGITAFLITSLIVRLREKEETLLDSERNLFEENLRQVRLVALGQGIAGAAHGIKNILNGIEAGNYLLETGLKRQDVEKIAKGLNMLQRNSGTMKELALDMLTYSRPRQPEYEPADINEICLKVVALLEAKASDDKVSISADLQPGIGEVVLDPRGIYRCVLNLVGNAIDACDKEPGMVEVATRLTGERERLTISISDNGCGIGEESRDKIFAAFFSTKGSKGTGIGLAVTEKIISEHGGDIRFESELNVGTRFEITLPTEPPGGNIAWKVAGHVPDPPNEFGGYS